MMVHPKKLRPLEEVSNLEHDRKSMKQKPLEDKAKTSNNTPWHGSKTTAQKHSPTQIRYVKQVKGTPYPRTKNTIKHSPLPDIKTTNHKGFSPLEEMHAAHLGLSEALKHVDGMMETAHRLRLSKQLSDEEARNFTSAFSAMTEQLKEWQNFFQTADGRLRSPQKREALTLTEVTSPSETLGVSFSFLDNSISSSPLVPCSLQSTLFCLTPLDRSNVSKRDYAAIAEVKAVLDTENLESKSVTVSALGLDEFFLSLPLSPPKSAAPSVPDAAMSSSQLEVPDVLPPKSDSQEPHVVSPLCGTPRIISPPRSVPLKGPTPSSGGSSVGTPPNIREHLRNLPSSPPSVDLQTPCIPKELVLRYPRSFGKMGSAGTPSTPIPETPGFGGSPPKTCKPIGCLKTGVFVTSARSSEPTTPCSAAPKYFETPFVTPGSVLPPTPMSWSRNLTPLVDDITASAIKRMGVKGLEEELWRKLRAWNIDSCVTGGHPYAKSRLSFGGSRNGFSNDLESIKETSEHGPGLNSFSDDGFAVRRRDHFI